MADINQLYDALRKADAAGNAEDAKTLAAAIRAQSTASTPVPHPPTALDTFATSPIGSSIKGAAEAMGNLEEGIPRGIAEIASYGGNVKGPISDFFNSVADKFGDVNKGANSVYEQARANMGKTGFDYGRLAGDILSPANFALGGIASKVPVAASLLGKIAQGTAAGATMGGLTAPDGSRVQGAVLGGGLGGIGPMVASAAAKVLSNPSVSPAVQKLLDAGVRLTPGQILGGAWKGVEDKAASHPLIGAFQAGAQNRAIGDFNRAAFNSALDPIGASLPLSVPVGRKAVDYAAQKIGDVYDTVLPSMTGQIDKPFFSDLQTVANKAQGAGVAQSVLDRFQNVVKSQLLDKADHAGTYSGDTLKGIQSELSRLSAKYSGSESADDRELGDLLQDTHGAFRDMLGRLNPQQAPVLKAADAAWAQYARIRRAASAVGAKEGVFSGPQFANAVRASDKSAGKGSYAKGKALMQDLSDPAKEVLPSSVPDSGTAGRLMLGSALTGGHLLPLIGPSLVPASLLSAGYTRPGTAILRSLLTGARPQPLQAVGNAAAKMNPALTSIPLTSLLNAFSVQQGN